MGHYASEMDPNWGKHIDHGNRVLRLKKQLMDVPLSRFTTTDLPHLHRLFVSWQDVPTKTLEHLERKVRYLG